MLFIIKNIKSEKSLFDSTYLKNKKLKNRIFFGAVFDDSFHDGKMSPKILKRIETLVKNDVGLIVTGAALVGDYSTLLGKECLRIDDDKYIDEFKKLSDVAHEYNTTILLQINHLGLQSSADEIYSPSKDKGIFKDIDSKEMTKDDILRIQNYFVEASNKSQKGRI